MQFMGYFNTILTQNQVFSHGKQSIFHQLFFNETFVSTNYMIHPLHKQQKIPLHKQQKDCVRKHTNITCRM